MYNIYVTILLHRAGDLIYVYAYYNPGKYEPKVKIIGGVPHTNKRLIHWQNKKSYSFGIQVHWMGPFQS